MIKTKINELRSEVEVDTIVGICPKCGRDLIIKSGKFGKFIGCKGYAIKGCRTTYNIKSFTIFDEGLKININFKDCFEGKNLVDYARFEEIVQNNFDELNSENQEIASKINDAY